MSAQNCNAGKDPVPKFVSEDNVPVHSYEAKTVRAEIVKGVIQVDPRRFKFCRLTVPATAVDVHVVGRFKVVAGGEKDVVVSVLDANGFNLWRRGKKALFYYNSYRVDMDIFNIKLPTGGIYYLMFDNSFSIRSPKSVEVNAELIYKIIQTCSPSFLSPRQ
jgi:hypothetical protein